MDWPWIAIALGVLIVVSRGPLIFRPPETLELYRGLLATDARARVWGVLFLVLGLLCGWAAVPMGGSAELLVATLALLMLSAAGWALAAPTGYRTTLDRFLLFLEGTVDAVALRFIGVLAVGIGLLLIVVGVQAL